MNFPSTMCVFGGARCAPYVVPKHGVLGLRGAAALEYPAHGIWINALDPGGAQ